eukprot:6003439-Amphidinium_carterae.1
MEKKQFLITWIPNNDRPDCQIDCLSRQSQMTAEQDCVLRAICCLRFCRESCSAGYRQAASLNDWDMFLGGCTFCSHCHGLSSKVAEVESERERWEQKDVQAAEENGGVADPS